MYNILMQNKSPQEQRRFVFLIAGLSDAAIGIFFVLVALRIISIFSDLESWIFFIIGGVFFTTGSFMTIFNLTPKE
jgi:hypothetical protein